MMRSYWLGIMAVCLLAALVAWIALVFMADKRGSARPQQNSPHREVVGGTFEARRGGRQVMPDPTESIAHEAGEEARAGPHGAGEEARASVPEQRGTTETEHAARQREHR